MDFFKKSMGRALTVIPPAYQAGKQITAPRHDHARDAAILNSFALGVYTSAGHRIAKLDKVEHWKDRTVGFFSVVCRNPQTGFMERYAFRCGVRKGVVSVEKSFPTQAWR